MIHTLLKKSAAGEAIKLTLEKQDRHDPHRWRVRWGGHQVEVTIELVAPGAGRLEIRSRWRPFYFVQRGQSLQVWLDGVIHCFDRVDRSAARRSAGLTETAAQVELIAPMPGTIRKINARSGQSFEAHQPLIIMESMKMELTLSAPRAGVLKRILCQEGQMVEMGAVLAELEEPKL